MPAEYLKRTDAGWAVARDDYYVQTGSMFENPFGVPREEIIRIILDNPAEVVAQVVFGKYVESSGVVFTAQLIHQMLDRTIPVVRSQTYVAAGAIDAAKAHKTKGRGWWGDRYCTGIDFARKTDYTVISVLDTLRKPSKLVYWKRLNRVPWSSIYAEVGKAAHLFGPQILCDASGPQGDVIMNTLEGKVYCPVHHLAIDAGSVCMEGGNVLFGCKPERDYVSLSVCEPYYFNERSKYELLDHLRLVLGDSYDPRKPDADFGNLRAPVIPQLQEELTFYTWDDKKLMTDCVMSLALAAWWIEDTAGGVLAGSPWGE
jgi:hypothetical protein